MTPTINILACELAATQLDALRGKPFETFNRENLETLIEVRNARFYFDNQEALCTR